MDDVWKPPSYESQRPASVPYMWPMMSVMVQPVEPAASRPGRSVRPTLRLDQERGLAAAVLHLRRPHTRALYVAATGTGNTLVSIRAADELGGGLVLVVVPTLDLAAQTALAWRRDGHLEHTVIARSVRTQCRVAPIRHLRVG